MDSASRSSRYDGEDTTDSSDREIRGWYSYGVAAEVFAVCGVGSFLPVTLEQLAREVGVLLSDGTTSCVEPATATRLGKRDDSICVVPLFGQNINTASFALYSSSLAVFTQTLILISIGAIADYGGNRKRLLLTFGFVGSTASMFFLFVGPSIYLFSVLLTVISVASLGCGFVLLNSFLPVLVANHPSVQKSDDDAILLQGPTQDDDDEAVLEDDFMPENGLLGNNSANETHLDTETATTALKLSNQISSKGVGIGYAAAVLVQIISIVIILVFQKIQPTGSSNTSTLPMRVVLFVVGLWWALFTIPTMRWLRRRPGPPLPVSQPMSRNRWLSALHYVLFAWRSLWKTIKIAARLRQVILFLVGWFLLSDGIATISGTAILFARTELKMGTAAVAMLSITATASGIAGAFCWPIIGRKYKLNSISIVLACIFFFEFIPVYGLLGFIPFFKSLGFIGLQQVWEIYPLAFILGFVMGGISSYCRSVYGSLIPPGMEAAFYALYAVTDKGSSVIGPAIVGRIVDATGSIRMGFWFLAVLMISPVPLFWFVDIDKGRRDGLMMAQRLRSKGQMT